MDKFNYVKENKRELLSSTGWIEPEWGFQKAGEYKRK